MTGWSRSSFHHCHVWRCSDLCVQVRLPSNQPLACPNDNKQLFALSHDENIHRLSTGTTLSKWAIHSSYQATCIALASPNPSFLVPLSLEEPRPPSLPPPSRYEVFEDVEVGFPGG